MKKLFLQHPGLYGAVLGGCSLGLGQLIYLLCTLTQIRQQVTHQISLSSFLLDKDLILFFILPTLCWGSILGLTAGVAAARCSQNKRDAARSLLQRVGGTCSLLAGFYFAYQLWNPFSPNELAGIEGLKMIGRAFLFDFNLQASLLTLITGLLLPRSSTDMVQVTENLRL